MAARLRHEGGFGLIELLIAMTVLSVGILAVVAGFSSGYVAINRATRVSSASALADQQMERFRSLAYSNLSVGTTTTTYSKTSSPPSPDGRQYTVTTTVTTQNAPGTTRQFKVVTVSVSDSTGQLASEQSTFDRLSGCDGTLTSGSAACS